MKKTLSRLSKPLIFSLFALILPNQSWARNSTGLSDQTLMAYILVLVLLLVVLAIVYASIAVIRLTLMMNASLSQQAGIPAAEQESWWMSFKKRHITGDLLPTDAEQDRLIDHAYDGIQELDNHMPPWLRYVFWGTIAFAAIYLLNFAVLNIVPTSEQEYVAEVTKAQKDIEAYKLTAAKGINEDNVELVKDATSLEVAKGIFAHNCQACHGAAGEGGVGPNLTDEYWLHGGSIQDVFKTVKYGVTQKGMIAWQQKLQPDQIQQVASYILSLQGTNPANAKAPQGDKYLAQPSDATSKKVSMQ